MRRAKQSVIQVIRRVSQRYSVSTWGALLLAVPSGCLAIVLILLLVLRSEQKQLWQQIEATENRVRTNQLVLQALIDHETALRGYLLTQDEQFMVAYQTAKRDLPPVLTQLAAQSPDQQKLVDDLQRQINHRFAITEAVLAFARRFDRQGATSLFTNSQRVLSKADSQKFLNLLTRGKASMDGIRQTIDEFEQIQQKQLRLQLQKLEDGKDLSARIVTIGSGLTLVTYAGAAYLFWLLDRQVFQKRRQLRQVYDETQALTNNLADGVIILGSQGLIQTLNPSAEAILGYRLDALRGRSLVHILFPPQSDRAMAQIDAETWVQARLETGEVEQMQARRPNGDVLPIELSISQSTAQSQNLIVIMRDISERIRLTTALEEKVSELAELNQVLFTTNRLLQNQKQSLANFVQAAAHDLKTPLRGIASLAHWIEADIAVPMIDSEIQGYFQLLQQRVKRMQIMIDGLLCYAQIDAWIERKQTVDMNLLLTDVLHRMDIPAGFTVKVMSPLPTLYSSYQALELIFEQLIDNAIEHHDRNVGNVTIRAESTATTIEVMLQDDGPGIAPDYRENVFKMFQVIEHAPDVSVNTGVGLALVQKTVTLLGGEVKLKSVAQGQRGLLVHITLPRLS